MGHTDRYPEVGLSEALVAIAGDQEQSGDHVPQAEFRVLIRTFRVEGWPRFARGSSVGQLACQAGGRK